MLELARQRRGGEVVSRERGEIGRPSRCARPCAAPRPHAPRIRPGLPARRRRRRPRPWTPSRRRRERRAARGSRRGARPSAAPSRPRLRAAAPGAGRRGRRRRSSPRREAGRRRQRLGELGVREPEGRGRVGAAAPESGGDGYLLVDPDAPARLRACRARERLESGGDDRVVSKPSTVSAPRSLQLDPVVRARPTGAA